MICEGCGLTSPEVSFSTIVTTRKGVTYKYPRKQCNSCNYKQKKANKLASIKPTISVKDRIDNYFKEQLCY